MRVVIQRVSRASVNCESGHTSRISGGMLILLGIEEDDTDQDIDWLVSKVANLRIFNDEDGIMNKSIIESGGKILVISQFTLYASTRKGNRPSYIKSAKPAISIPVYNEFIKKLGKMVDNDIATGVFGDHMEVDLVNDGPVTIIIDTKIRE